MQVKLLRAIQEKAVRPVGDSHEVPVDIRVLSATHKDLPGLVQDGLFRQDLFYRINVIEIRVPPLRERSGDIALLARHILLRIAREYECTPIALTDAAVDYLKGYHFPGNVRELENILERAFTLCDGDVIDTGDLQLGSSYSYDNNTDPSLLAPTASVVATADIELSEQGLGLEGYLESIERKAIEQALEATRWNKTAAAKKLGISFRALRYKLKKLGLE
jgi:two-component system response regulator PilR (NtrC family)